MYSRQSLLSVKQPSTHTQSQTLLKPGKVPTCFDTVSMHVGLLHGYLKTKSEQTNNIIRHVLHRFDRPTDRLQDRNICFTITSRPFRLRDRTVT
jgi:hypothetical protein